MRILEEAMGEMMRAEQQSPGESPFCIPVDRPMRIALPLRQ
jgi:hypothetical protein